MLSAFEESGQARRGYVVEGLGAAQFAMDGAVDRLRAVHTARERGGPLSRAAVLAAADPANAYGAALPWPDPPDGATHKPGRKAGSLVVLVDGELTLYMERGGKTLLAWPDTRRCGARRDPGPDHDPALATAAEALARAARRAPSARSRWNGSTGTPPSPPRSAPCWRAPASTPPPAASGSARR